MSLPIMITVLLDPILSVDLFHLPNTAVDAVEIRIDLVMSRENFGQGNQIPDDIVNQVATSSTSFAL
jgi:hypothetical protein